MRSIAVASVIACLVGGAWGSVEGADEPARRLLAAAARGDAAQVVALLRAGAPAGARDASGRPALLVAALSGRPEVVRALLRAGAAPDVGDRGGWTALHQVAQEGDVSSARALLAAGATPDLRARSGGTALDVAERNGRTELAALLRAQGARGSGKSTGDLVCVRPWKGDGYCAEILAVEKARVRLRVSHVLGCASGCAADALCSAGKVVGVEVGAGSELWVPDSCLTHTGVAR